MNIDKKTIENLRDALSRYETTHRVVAASAHQSTNCANTCYGSCAGTCWTSCSGSAKGGCSGSRSF